MMEVIDQNDIEAIENESMQNVQACCICKTQAHAWRVQGRSATFYECPVCGRYDYSSFDQFNFNIKLLLMKRASEYFLYIIPELIPNEIEALWSKRRTGNGLQNTMKQ